MFEASQYSFAMSVLPISNEEVQKPKKSPGKVKKKVHLTEQQQKFFIGIMAIWIIVLIVVITSSTRTSTKEPPSTGITNTTNITSLDPPFD